MLTIGHSTLAIETFLAILSENGVRMLADIRTIPKSRHNPQFAQENLSRSLADAGLEYRWHRDLGGLRHPRKDSINTGWRNTSFRGYADYMQTPEFASAIDDLLKSTPHDQTVIMCAEAVPWRCHRSLVADALTVRRIPVEHIYHDGGKRETGGHSRREPHKLTSFLRAEGQRLWYPAEDDLFAATPPQEREQQAPEPSSASAAASNRSASATTTRRGRTGSGRATREK
ncbi:MAG: DUF488 domain-containing protein [Silvibacterium sp.]|nr:DUF488 domain-containing protein [Silvibacterium sp.]